MKHLLFLTAFISLLLISCGGGKKDVEEEGQATLTPQEQQELFEKAKQIFGALPDKMPGNENDNPDLVALGKKLFFETKLSVNGTQSCNTCHDIEKRAGDDGKPVSDGAIAGKKGTRNSPTVFNAGYQFVQFWDGREKDLKGQAKGPILNPVEMAMKDEKAVLKVLSTVPEYKEMFIKAYPKDKNPITYDNLANAIAAFERTMISKSRYDDYIAGNQAALTDAEQTGLKKFIDVGCITCHTGPLFGGNIYQKMGLVKPYSNLTDLGRFDVTKNEADKFMFKVSQLRNISLTSPYFHDGTAKTLDEAIKTMASINLGKELKPEEIKSIHAFLIVLTDKNLEKTIAKK